MKPRFQTLMIFVILLSTSCIAYSQNNKLVIYKTGGTMNTVLLEDIDRMEFIFSIEQSIPLSTGWNMISSYVTPQEQLMDSVFKDIVSNVLIVKNDAGKLFVPSYNINTIGDWNIYDGYQVYSTANINLQIIGIAVEPENTPISLNSGWNMISYLRSIELLSPTGFASITDNNNLLIAKDSKGKIYVPAYNINTIGNLKPGEGYQIYVTQADTLIYPAE